MRKHSAFYGLIASALMVVGISFYSHGFTQSQHYDITFTPAHAHFNADFIALNDAAIPSVVPVYGKHVNVYAVGSPLSGFVKDIKPTANSPPISRLRG